MLVLFNVEFSDLFLRQFRNFFGINRPLLDIISDFIFLPHSCNYFPTILFVRSVLCYWHKESGFLTVAQFCALVLQPSINSCLLSIKMILELRKVTDLAPLPSDFAISLCIKCRVFFAVMHHYTLLWLHLNNDVSKYQCMIFTPVPVM